MKMADNHQPGLKVIVGTLISTVKLQEGLEEGLSITFVQIILWIKHITSKKKKEE